MTKAVLTVTADNKSMSYGGTFRLYDTMTGFVNGDTQGSATSGSPNLSTMPLPPLPPSQAISVSMRNSQAANYTSPRVCQWALNGQPGRSDSHSE